MFLDTKFQIWLAALVLAYCLSFIMFLKKYIGVMDKQHFKRYFYRILKNHLDEYVQSHNKNADILLSKIQVSFQQLQNELPKSGKELTLIRSLQGYYNGLLSGRINDYAEYNKSEVCDILFCLIEGINENEPFAEMSVENSVFFKQAYSYIQSNNQSAATNTLIQIAKEYRKLSNTSKNQERINRLAVMVSIIGVILTVFFGLLSYTILK